MTKASVRERLLARDFEDVRAVVESLADEFDVVEIAAAAIKLAHAATADGNEAEIEVLPPHAGSPRRSAKSSKAPVRRFDGTTVRCSSAQGGATASVRPTSSAQLPERLG